MRIFEFGHGIESDLKEFFKVVGLIVLVLFMAVMGAKFGVWREQKLINKVIQETVKAECLK